MTREQWAKERARELRSRVVDAVADYFSRWTSVVDEAVPPVEVFASLLLSIDSEVRQEQRKADMVEMHSTRWVQTVRDEARREERKRCEEIVGKVKGERSHKRANDYWQGYVGACDEILRRMKEEK